MPGHYNPDEFSQLHKTLSKSFVMQRKTLVRVLGLEGRVSELEAQQAAEEQAKEGIDEILNDIHEAKEKEVGGTKTKTKPKAKAKPKVKPKAKKTRVKGKRIRKPKIDADKFKRGTSQETVEERLERQSRNRQETAAAEEHKKSDEFTETTTGTDPKTGEPLSSEERKKRFKAKFIPKTGFDSKDIKPETEAEIGDDSKKDKIVTFLNGDVKDNLDDVRDDLKQIEGLLKDQNKSADDQYEEMRQGILAAKKKKREEKLEDKDKKPGSGLKDKMLDMVTKPAGSFFDKIIRFVTMTFLGSVVNRLLSILKDPAQLLDPIKQFFNVFIGMFNTVMKSLWMITGAPINLVISTINKGVGGIIDGINSVSGLLALPKLDAPEIPLIPGPPQVPMIPLSKTAQEKNEEAVGMSGGGLVPGDDGIDGAEGKKGGEGLDGKEIIGKDGKDGKEVIGKDGKEVIGKDGKEVIGKDGKDGTSVAMAGGGVVPGPQGSSGMLIPTSSMNQQIMQQTDFGEDGSISTRQSTVEERKQQYAKMGMPSMELWDGSVVPNVGKMGVEEIMKGVQMVREGMVDHPDKVRELDEFMATNPYAQPEKLQEMINRTVPGTQEQVLGDLGDDISAKAKMSGGGIVRNLNVRRQGFGGGGYAAPYPTTNLLGMGHNVIDTAPGNIMGYNKGGKVIRYNKGGKVIRYNKGGKVIRYNKGGKVPGSGTGDTVPAMLTPGEFVMSKGAVDMIGSDKLMAMNKAGGGTNQPKLMKFAGGGIVPGIEAPSKKRGGVVVISGGGGGGNAPAGGGDSGGGSETPNFSSTDPNNITIPVVKSLYNIMG